MFRKLINRIRKRRFCKANRWHCPDCIYHEHLWDGIVYRGVRCHYPMKEKRMKADSAKMVVKEEKRMSEKMYKASDVIGILLEEITNAEFLRVAERLSDIPSEVVRCKDCVHYHKAGRGHPDTEWCKRLICGTIKPDFYCADGERISE